MAGVDEDQRAHAVPNLLASLAPGLDPADEVTSGDGLAVADAEVGVGVGGVEALAMAVEVDQRQVGPEQRTDCILVLALLELGAGKGGGQDVSELLHMSGKLLRVNAVLGLADHHLRSA